MSLASMGLALAPSAPLSSRFHVSSTVLVIVVVLALLGVISILGWRAPDRSPGAETEAERKRIED